MSTLALASIGTSAGSALSSQRVGTLKLLSRARTAATTSSSGASVITRAATSRRPSTSTSVTCAARTSGTDRSAASTSDG